MSKQEQTGSNELIQEINLICGVLASELREIRSNGLIIASEGKLDAVLKIIDKASKIKALTSKEKDPEEEETQEESDLQPIKKKRNIQDFVING